MFQKHFTHCFIHVECAIANAVIEIKQCIEKKQQPIIRQWRLLLFPEQYVKEYYTVIFRLIMWMTFICIGAFLFL